MTQFNFEGIGTRWQIDIYQELLVAEEQKILTLIKNRVETFDKAYSRFRDDSIITKMSKETGNFLLPDDARSMINLYYDLYKITDGFFTPLVGNLLSDAGYDANYSLQKKNLRKVPSWEEVIFYTFPYLEIKQPAILDFGAGGKGYLVDLVGRVLEENNIFEYCIDAGGDILHKGRQGIKIGLENPKNTKEVIGIYELQNNSICGSSGNRRAWDDFTHIMNPKTLTSQKDILAVWVVAKTGLLADSLATCLFFVDAHKLTNKYDFEYLLVKNDFSIKKSRAFSGELFLR